MNETKAAIPQPPSSGVTVCIKDLVMQDIQARVEAGLKKYGTYLMANNGRDALWDAYQEALDLAMYLRQAIAERDDAIIRKQETLDRLLSYVYTEKKPDGLMQIQAKTMFDAFVEQTEGLHQTAVEIGTQTESQADELKPCPFPSCGGKGILFERDGLDNPGYYDPPYFDVRCSNPDCFLNSGGDWYFSRKEDAIEKWNSNR